MIQQWMLKVRALADQLEKETSRTFFKSIRLPSLTNDQVKLETVICPTIAISYAYGPMKLSLQCFYSLLLFTSDNTINSTQMRTRPKVPADCHFQLPKLTFIYTVGLEFLDISLCLVSRFYANSKFSVKMTGEV